MAHVPTDSQNPGQDFVPSATVPGISASDSLGDLVDVILTSAAQGDILYNNGTAWVNLPPGVSGRFLKTNGAGANPEWAAGAGGGASELSDLSDVNTSTPTNRNFLIADGVDWESRAAVIADISDLTFGIANTNAVLIDDATVTAANYARFTVNGIEGLTVAEMKSDISLDNVENTALSTWAGSTNITTLGTITTAGGNVSLWTNDAGYITATLTNEEVQDIVGAMVTGNTETLITVTYQDADGTLDFVVDNDLSNYSNASSNFAVTTGSLSQFAATTSAQLRGVLSDEVGTGAAVFAGANVSVLTNDAGYITATLTDEEVQDIVGAMVTGNTETLITVTYQDADGTLDFVVDNDLSNYSNASSNFAVTTGNLSQFAATTSAQLAGVISDETGSGALVFATSPTLVTPVLGTPTSGTLTNCTGLPTAGLASRTGSDANVVTGTAGVDQNLIEWDANGDAIDSGLATADVVTGSSTDTLTNKTIDANGTGNAISNINVAEIESGSSLLEGRIEVVIDGGGSAITTGIKLDLEVAYSCTIEEVRMLADQSGSIVVDIWKDTYANFPPTNADSITASATPTISAATKSEDTTLTGWTTSLSAGDILRFNVDSASTIERLTLVLEVTKT